MTASEKILAYMRSLERPASPSEIARFTGISPNTVRPTLSRLVRQGKAVRKYRAAYCTVQGVGASTPPPRVHGLTVVSPPLLYKLGLLPWKFEIPGPTGTEDDVTRLRIQWGETFKRVHWTLKSHMGLEYEGLAFVFRLVEEVLSCRGLEVSMDDWEITLSGLLYDQLGYELSKQALTVRDFKGALFRIYQKDHGVRTEAHTPLSSTASELMVLMQSGQAPYAMAQSVMALMNELREDRESRKYTNDLLVKVLAGQGALQKALFRALDRLEEAGGG